MEKAEDSDCSYSCNDEPFINVPCGAKRRQSVYEITHSSVLNGIFVTYFRLRGEGCSSVVKRSLRVRWVVGSISPGRPFEG